MKNVTISMDEDLASWARVEAAKAGKSVSAWIADLLMAKRSGGARKGVDASGMSAMERFLAAPLVDLGYKDGKYPKREELYERESLRRYEHSGVGEGPERRFETDDSGKVAGETRQRRSRRARRPKSS
jgi:hypothetical protein